MPLSRDQNGIWSATNSKDDEMTVNPHFREALPRYLTAFDSLFSAAKRTNELEFLLSIFRVRGAEDAGWDPYETTIASIPALVRSAEQLESELAAQHLQLWIYGHIVEASEPYELIVNLLEVARGSHYNWRSNFPSKKANRPWSPGEKIEKIRAIATVAKRPETAMPLAEVWDRELRNAIFHADYALCKDELRIIEPARRVPTDDLLRLLNRALAYHTALAMVFGLYVASYTEPKVIPTSPHFQGDPDLRWTVIVRENFGVAGVKDSWTPAELRAGRIPLRVGRFFDGETAILDADPTLCRLAPIPGISSRFEYGCAEGLSSAPQSAAT